MTNFLREFMSIIFIGLIIVKNITYFSKILKKYLENDNTKSIIFTYI